MDHFVKPLDDLSRSINEKAAILYQQLLELPLDELQLPELPRKYYEGCHVSRPFFSVQTAAELLYRSIKLTGKPADQLVVMDYGAGLGSLFLLAKMIGCKKVIYNDIMEDMAEAAKIVSQNLGIPIDIFIAADHRGTLKQLKEQGVSCDIILSRNVVEHIYDLDDFYGAMAADQPNALIYFSTTANFQNPAMLWFHKRLHKRHELENEAKRKQLIATRLQDDGALGELAVATRGLAMEDLDKAIEEYRNHKKMPDPSRHYTNTCDPENGVWAEHILPIKDYHDIIETKGYKLTVLPAFWDTHYSSKLKNFVGKTMNLATGLLGKKAGLTTTAFIYIIAEKKA